MRDTPIPPSLRLLSGQATGTLPPPNSPFVIRSSKSVVQSAGSPRGYAVGGLKVDLVPLQITRGVPQLLLHPPLPRGGRGGHRV